MVSFTLLLSITFATSTIVSARQKSSVRDTREFAKDYSLVEYSVENDGASSKTVFAMGKKGVEKLRRSRLNDQQVNTAIPLIEIDTPGSSNKDRSHKRHKGMSIDIRRKSTQERSIPKNVVEVFKDSNCDNDEAETNDLNNNGKAILKLSISRNSRNDGFFVKAEGSPIHNLSESTTEVEGISKLVASTQDLVSNEDLLEINGAAERDFTHNDDEISKVLDKKNEAQESRQFTYFNVRPTTDENTVPIPNKNEENEARRINNNMKHRQTSNRLPFPPPQPQFKTPPALQFIPPNRSQPSPPPKPHTPQLPRLTLPPVRPVLQNPPEPDVAVYGYSVEADDGNSYNFAKPIVVPDKNYKNFDNQIKMSVAATVEPYMTSGYEITGVKKFGLTLIKNNTKNLVKSVVLSPITVGLRLANANQSDLYKSLDNDRDFASSKVVQKVLNNNNTEKKGEFTTVEIQKAIPIEINEYSDDFGPELGEGRNNFKEIEAEQDDVPATTKYRQAVDYFNNLVKTMGEVNRHNDDFQIQDIGEKAEESKLIDEIAKNDGKGSNYHKHFGDRFIQPIIIEKEVPVTKFVDRYIEKKVPYPEPYEVVKEVPVEKRVLYPVPYEKIVEKPVEVTKYVERPHPVEVKVPHPVPVQVPYPVEQKIYVEKKIPVPVERVVEKQVFQRVPVPTPVGVPYEVKVPYEQPVLLPVPIDQPYPVPFPVEKEIEVERIVEKKVPYPVETRVPYPVPYETKVAVPYPVETRVPYPVEKIVEKQVHVPHYVEKKVPVPVAVPQPYPVDRYFERKVPYPVTVEKIVEQKVGIPYPVSVPYPVEKIVERVVEKPVQVTKYIHRPYKVETRVPFAVPYETIVEKKVPVPVQVRVPYEVRVPYPVEKIVEKPVPYPNATPPYAISPYAFDYMTYFGKYPSYPQNNYEVTTRKSMGKLEQQQDTNNDVKYEPLSLLYKDDIKEKYGTNHITSTQWGNLYASSYQYTSPKSAHFKSTPKLSKYMNYITNNVEQYNANKSAGNTDTGFYPNLPPFQTPVGSTHQHVFTNGYPNDFGYYPQTYSSNEQVAHSYNSPVFGSYQLHSPKYTMRRNDKTGRKFKNLKIEYGGFRPPMVPSIEVDLDGIPVNSKNAS